MNICISTYFIYDVFIQKGTSVYYDSSISLHYGINVELESDLSYTCENYQRDSRGSLDL